LEIRIEDEPFAFPSPPGEALATFDVINVAGA
jgi:hypothetical protein